MMDEYAETERQIKIDMSELEQRLVKTSQKLKACLDDCCQELDDGQQP
jgi:hypothetical protein